MFTCCLWLLLHSKAELSSCNKDLMTCQGKNIYQLTFAKKGLSIPALRENQYHLTQMEEQM